MIFYYSYWKYLSLSLSLSHLMGNCRKPKSGGSFYQYPNRFKLSNKEINIRQLFDLVQTARVPQKESYRRSITNLSVCSRRNKHIEHMWEGQTSDSFRMTLKFALNLQQERKWPNSQIFTLMSTNAFVHAIMCVTSSTRTLYMRIVESSMPTAIILLSWGWKARYVAAGGGGMKVVITCNFPIIIYNWSVKVWSISDAALK